MSRAGAGSRLEIAVDNRVFGLLSISIALVLAVHADHLPWWLTGCSAALLAWRWWRRRRRPGRVPRWIKLPLLGLLTLAVIGSYGSIFGREPGAALAIGLLVLKAMECESTRDVRVAVSFACFALVSALLFRQDLVNTMVVALAVLPALATMRAMEPAQRLASLSRTLLPGLALLGATLPLALLAFALVPRLSSPLWGAPTPDEARTGLSDTMSPGNLTSLLIDDSPALRVSFDGTVPTRDLRYFRAYVMWDFDGRSWSRGRGSPEPAAPLEATQTIAYQVTMVAPSRRRILPALDVAVEAPANARLLADHEVLANEPVTHSFSYELRSALHYKLQPALDAQRRRRGLELPGGFNPRTHALAESWRTRYGNDDAAIVTAGLALLRTGHFRYSLTPPPLGRDSVDDFLFNTREGFCEHYASAFTVLMRSAGIPARVVTGYQGGYWSELGNYLLLRYSDAHAWSEVWLRGRGWVRVDPTAAARPERVTQGATAALGAGRDWYDSPWLEGLRNRWDIVNRWWDQGVVGFDALRQRGMLTQFGIRDTSTRTMALLIALTCVLFMALGLTWSLWQGRRRDSLREAFGVLERKLAQRGVVRRRGEGPRDYLARAARALPAQRGALAQLSTDYLQLRYGANEASPEPLRAFRRAVREFHAARVVQ
jgi:transglutaminase-like putative cysteine protease